MEEWPRVGWLQPYDGEFDGFIPLMAVIQHNKDKVRPVLDYRELNQYVSSHTAGSEVGGEKLRAWRKLGDKVCTIDLRKAYLQIHVAPHLWKYQVVQLKGKNYCLTRLDLECGLDIKVELVKSSFNKADCLTRVPRKWLNRKDNFSLAMVVESKNLDQQTLIKQVHNLHHFGVNRTLVTAKRCHPDVRFDKNEVEQVVKTCKECLSIDTTPIKREPGHLNCEETWYRLAIDVTHYLSAKYLTFVDCGPSRFCIWRTILSETEEQVYKVLLETFSERGPPTELLMSNSCTFRSGKIQQLCDKWSVTRLFRCVYRPKENGIVERNHRTIKRIAARSRGSIREMVYWYNLTPKEGLNGDSSPSSQLFNYKWRCKRQPILKEEYEGTEFSKGDTVYVKPTNPKCTARWQQGHVSGQLSENKVDVDGRLRHVADIRKANGH